MRITDPMVAEKWLRNTERVLNRIECTIEKKVSYATSLFEQNALDWWETIPGSGDVPVTLTWADFLKEFMNKYMSPMYKARKKLEFLNLKQNELSVVDYEVQFVRLSKYATEEVATDELKRDKFERGLTLEIREGIVIKPPTYKDLLKTTIQVEETILERNALEAKRRRVTSAFTTSTRTSGGSSFRGAGFQRGSFKGCGLSRPN